MVDVSGKPVTARRAVAEATVAMSPETLSLVIDGGGAKGDVLGVAELAGVMGGKRTSELIPLCHPLPLTDLQVSITPDRAGGALRIRAEAATTGQTGVEMEAMTAVSVAALTVYDMVKGVERGVEIGGVRLSPRVAARAGTGSGRRPMRATAADRRPGDASAGRSPSRPASAGGGRRPTWRALVLTAERWGRAGAREDTSGAGVGVGSRRLGFTVHAQSPTSARRILTAHPDAARATSWS